MSSSSGIAGLIPGANPSGLQLSVPYGAQQGGQASLGGNLNPLLPINTSTSTGLPTLPQGAVSTSATSGLPAPSAQSSTGAPAVPGFPANGAGPSVPGGGSGTTSSSLGLGSLSPSQQSSLQRNLSKTYGSGLASTILQFLQGGAGYNQAAINNLVSGLQPQFQQNLQVGELESQMYEQAIQNYMSVLMGAASPTATRIENTPSTFDQIASGLGAAAGGAGSILSGLGIASAGGAI